MRENRIKELTFSNITPTGSPFNASDFSESRNGELLEVRFSADNTGSLYLRESGTGQELFRRNAPSGTGIQFGYPRSFTQSTTGSIAGAVHAPFVFNGPLVLSVSGAISGTLPYTATIKYR